MAIRLEVGQEVRPFIEARKFLSPGQRFGAEVLVQPLEFEGIPGEVFLAPISLGEMLDNFQTPLGKVTRIIVYENGMKKEPKPPLRPVVSFTIKRSDDWRKLLDHKPMLKIGLRLYEVHYAQEVMQDIPSQLESTNHLIIVGSHLASPSVPSREIPVLLPYHLPTLARGISLIMR